MSLFPEHDAEEKPPQQTSWAYQRAAEFSKDEWITPRHILSAIGPFDLDPCAPKVQPWPTAARKFTIEDNGLVQAWGHDVVFCNPPYSTADKWLARCAGHNKAIVLIFARTETRMFFKHVWPKAEGLFFLRGRVTFHHLNGTPGRFTGGSPSVLIAYGPECAARLKRCKLEGFYLDLARARVTVPSTPLPELRIV